MENAARDDPIRAVRATLKLHQLVEKISLENQKRFGIPLHMHSGINTGLIVTHASEPLDGKFGMTGDTVNTGARLLAAAKAGEILISPETHKLVNLAKIEQETKISV